MKAWYAQFQLLQLFESKAYQYSKLTQDATPVASPPVYQMSQVSSTTGIKSRDPIWKFGKDEIIRLCRVYEEEIGLMYPVVDIEQVIVHGKNLYEFIGSALRTGLANVGMSYHFVSQTLSSSQNSSPSRNPH